MTVATPRECAECTGGFMVTSNRQTICDDCKRERSCRRCTARFRPRGREHICGSCRFKADPTTSRCAYCLAVYRTHGQLSRAEDDEKWHHFYARCIG